MWRDGSVSAGRHDADGHSLKGAKLNRLQSEIQRQLHVSSKSLLTP